MERRRHQRAVLLRAFLAQFLAGDGVGTDVQQRERLIWVLAFLLPPGFFLVIKLFHVFELVVTYFPERFEDLMARLAFLLVTYSMTGVGMLAVLAWDVLVFDRRDAMVLGPLPIAKATMMRAKLGALATLLIGASLAVNLVTAVPFAFVTANHASLTVLFANLRAHLVATLSAAAFVFGAMVSARALLAIAAGPRLATLLGSTLQFAFVCALLCFLMVIPATVGGSRPRYLDPVTAAWLPTTWFLGLFEWLRGSTEPAFRPLAARALAAVTLAVGGGALLSIAAFRVQLHAAVSATPPAGAIGRARLPRAIARALTGPDRAARGLAEFILLTIARNRQQQTPVAIAGAIGIAIVVAALGRAEDLASLMRPRTAVLWVPLVLAYWGAVGVKTSFFVACELPAAWALRLHEISPRARWVSIRSALAAMLLPLGMGIAAVLTSVLVGWQVAIWHTLFVGAVTAVLVACTTLLVTHVPFVRPFPPGHTRLRTRWPLYVIGLFATARLPVLFELHGLHSPARMAWAIAMLVAIAVAIDRAGPRLRDRPDEHDAEDEAVDPDRVTVLALGPAG